MLAAGDQEGIVTLRSILHQSPDPSALNSAAYALSLAGKELPQAEAGARRSLDLLADETAAQTLRNVTSEQLGRSRTTIAAWDTLGTILMQEGRLDDAEPYLRSAWQLTPDTEIGMHLGQFEQLRNHKQAACDLFALAQAEEHPGLAHGTRLTPALHRELARQIDALHAEGLHPSFSNAPEELAKQRILRAVSTTSQDASTPLLLLVQQGKLLESWTIAPAKNAIPEADKLVIKADLSSWTPPSSTARLLIAASLACERNACSLVLQPF